MIKHTLRWAPSEGSSAVCVLLSILAGRGGRLRGHQLVLMALAALPDGAAQRPVRIAWVGPLVNLAEFESTTPLIQAICAAAVLLLPTFRRRVVPADPHGFHVRG